MTELKDIDNLLKVIAREQVDSQHWLYEDALQEARLRAWERLEEGHPRQIAQYAARQAVIDLVRGGRMTGSKQNRIPIGAHRRALSINGLTDDGEYELPLPYVEHEFDQIEDREVVEQLLAVLDDRARQMVVMKHYDEATPAEIAERFGVSRERVRQIIVAAYGKMRREHGRLVNAGA